MTDDRAHVNARMAAAADAMQPSLNRAKALQALIDAALAARAGIEPPPLPEPESEATE